MKSAALPSRTHTKISTTICPDCYCALIDDPEQRENHATWHRTQAKTFKPAKNAS